MKVKLNRVKWKEIGYGGMKAPFWEPADGRHEWVEEIQVDIVELARRFHDLYEQLASEYGYETREETREFDPGSPNGRLMIEVCRRIVEEMKGMW